MEKDLTFTCGNCKFVWKSSEAQKFADENSQFEEDKAEFIDYQEGYNCPICRSTDIGGK